MDLRNARRIVVYGLSSSGKSTLSEKLGQKLEMPVYHLDRLHFRPGTNWEAVPWEVFADRHQQAITDDRWVIEGGYSELLMARVDRADVILLLKMNRFACAYRFIRRYFRQKAGHEPRRGTPENLKEKLNWDMIWWILEPRSISPRRRKSYLLEQEALTKHRDKIVRLNSFHDADNLVASL